MRTFDEASIAALDRPAFSNGTQGYTWQANWCDRCLHDQSARRDDVKADPRNNGLLGCALLGVALTGKTPSEWLEQDRFSLADAYHCIEFRDETNPGPGYESKPEPPLPGQLVLFDAEPSVRMFVQPQTVAAASPVRYQQGAETR